MEPPTPATAPACAICLGGGSKPPSQTVVTTCSHRFCKDELVQWLALRGTCPVCRTGLGQCDVHLGDGAPLDVTLPTPPKPEEVPASGNAGVPALPAELSRDERQCLWLTFVLGFFCGFTWMCALSYKSQPDPIFAALISHSDRIGVCTFGSRARHDKRVSVRIPWIGNIVGTVLLCIALVFAFVWVIWPK